MEKNYAKSVMNQEGVINLDLGIRADIGEWKSDVSGHRDVAFKPAREGLKDGRTFPRVAGGGWRVAGGGWRVAGDG